MCPACAVFQALAISQYLLTSKIESGARLDTSRRNDPPQAQTMSMTSGESAIGVTPFGGGRWLNWTDGAIGAYNQAQVGNERACPLGLIEPEVHDLHQPLSSMAGSLDRTKRLRSNVCVSGGDHGDGAIGID
jgi:hypothetical protein